jgi:hypothetical protein
MPAHRHRENAPECEMSDLLSAMLHLSAHDYSWLAQFFSLLILPFVHEDLAIVAGAYLAVNDIMPVGLVALCIYGGMVASDFALYAIGAGARRLPWLRRLAVDDRVRNFARTLQRNLFGVLGSVAWCPASSRLPSSPAAGRASRSCASRWRA